MNRQFAIILWNRWLFGLLVVPVLLAVSIGMMIGWDLLLHQAGGKWVYILVTLPVWMGCHYGLERLTCRPAQIVVTDVGMRVHAVAASSRFSVEWADVASYKNAIVNGGRELRLWLHDGQKIKLAVSTTQGDMMEYLQLVHAVEQATATYNTGHPSPIIQRNNLLESTFIKVGLVAIPVLLLLLAMRSCHE